MVPGIRTIHEVEELVDDYSQFDEFVIDVETKGDHRLDPMRNDVFWVSLAGPGRCDVIPCGHPLGERVFFDPEDDQHRINPSNNHHQERRINESSGREKWFDIPPPFTPAPKQLWISDVTACLEPLLYNKKLRKVGQNVKFDLLSLTKYYETIIPGPFGDTLVAARLINENHKRYDLGSMAKREFGFEYAKIGKKLEIYAYSEAHLYSYLDSKFTWLLWEKFKGQLDREQVRHIFDLEMDLLPVLLDMERTGIAIDSQSLDSLGEEFLKNMARLQVAINDAAGFDVNLNANRQVAKVVYDILGHTCREYTPSGERSTAAKTLNHFSKDPVVKMMQEYAGLSKLHSTFVEGIRENLNDGRIHPNFKQVGTVSGRLSSTTPNVQQIPSRSDQGKRVRDVFIAGPGNSLVVSDLSQIELRMLAHFTQDRGLLRAYRKGEDLHGLTAATAFGPDYTVQQRGLAKNSNFALLYGAGPGTMVEKYQIPSVAMAKKLTQSFYATFRRVRPWKFQVLDEARARKKGKTPPYVMTILGRKRRLPQLHALDNYDRSSAERQAISVTISGSSADIFKMIMIDCFEELRREVPSAHILMCVHDELVVECPERHEKRVYEIVKRTMETVLDDDGNDLLRVPIVAEAKIVKRWSDAK